MKSPEIDKDAQGRLLVAEYAKIQSACKSLLAAKDYDAALIEAQRGFALLESHFAGLAFTMDAANTLAVIFGMLDRWAEAEPLLEKSVILTEQVNGAYHQSTATAYMMLGVAQLRLGRYADAEPLLSKALAVRLAIFDGGHPHVAIAMSNLAALFDKTGQQAKAQELRSMAESILSGVPTHDPTLHD